MKFGTMVIPKLTDTSQSAYYISPKWDEVKNQYSIQMYLTAPDGKTPLEKLSAELKFKK
jgi:hypothetical protein